MGLDRKIKRSKKKKAEKKMADKLGLFNKIPKTCLACDKSFDKSDRKMVMEWTVVVREKEGEVRLYCPTCWDTATKIMKEQ